MFNKIAKAAALAAIIGVSSMAATTEQAAAGGSVGFSVEFGGPVYGPGYGPGWGWGPGWGHGWGPGYGPKPHKGICKPRRAVKKAWKMGVRNGRIVRRNHKRVVVKGWRHGYRVRVVFANRRHCPVIALR